MDEISFTRLNLDDLDGVHSLWSDEAATLYTNFAFLPTKEECRGRLERTLAFYEKSADHFGPFVIRSKEGNFLGLTGGDSISGTPGTYEIWYFVERSHWGKKVATKAVQHLMKLMADSGRVRVLKAEAVVDNEPSWRFLEKLGFQRSDIISGGHKKNGRTWDRYSYSKSVS
jgi:RimJ/RimL family protein N-acetyltransferase